MIMSLYARFCREAKVALGQGSSLWTFVNETGERRGEEADGSLCNVLALGLDVYFAKFVCEISASPGGEKSCEISHSPCEICEISQNFVYRQWLDTVHILTDTGSNH